MRYHSGTIVGYCFKLLSATCRVTECSNDGQDAVMLKVTRACLRRLRELLLFRETLSLFRKARQILLTCLFTLCTSSLIWSQEDRDRHEQIFLSDESLEEKEQNLIETSSGFWERWFLKIYFRYPFPEREEGYYIDVDQYITLHLHSFFGFIDSTFKTNIDDKVAAVYAPLRHMIAERFIEDHSDEKTIPMFRLAHQYVTVKSIADLALKGVSRPFNVLSDSDMSNLYYDVLQCRPSALATELDKQRVLEGKLSVIALSYRHWKDGRHTLGISKREFINAFRALHMEAALADPPEEYCVWWDSCLKCGPSEDNGGEWVNWAAIGLSPYAFCHVLSVRRDWEIEQDRLWIDLERALGRFGKGITAVDVTQVESENDGNARVLGYAPGFLYDPESALEEVFKYLVSGDVHFSRVTFAEDRKLLQQAGTRILCAPPGFGVMRALFDTEREMGVIWVENWKVLEEKILLTALDVWLGQQQVWNGEGEAELSNEVLLDGHRVPFDDRRVWLPNSSIYKIESKGHEIPYYVKEQVALILQNDDLFVSEESRCGLLLYYQEDTLHNPEAVLGCAVNLDPAEDRWIATGVSKLHVPPASLLFESFKELYLWGRDKSNSASPRHGFSSLHGSQSAISWIWEENGMKGEPETVTVRLVNRDWPASVAL